MFYIIFLITNFFTLGVGVWLAMRHGEFMRAQRLGTSIVQEESQGMDATVQVDESPVEKESQGPTAEEMQEEPQNTPLQENQSEVEEIPQISNDPTSDHQISGDTEPPMVEMTDTPSAPEPEISEISPEAETEIPEIAPETVPETVLCDPPSQEVSAQETVAQEAAIQENDPVRAQEDENEMPPVLQSPLPSVEMLEQIIGMTESVPNHDDLQEIATQLQEICGVLADTNDPCYVSEDAEFFITENEEKYATTTICRPVVGRKK